MKIRNYLLICAFVLICLVTGCKPSADTSLTKLSIEQKYTIIEDNENWYYFDDGIYKINKNDGVRDLIYQAEILETKYLSVGAKCLNDGWFYYIDSNWDICRVKMNGQDHSVILNTKQFWEYDEQPVVSLAVVDDNLFIQMTFRLFRYDLQSEKITEVDGDARQLGFLAKDVYFCGREFTIYKMNVNGDEPEAILQSENVWDKSVSKNLYKSFIFVDGIMYYYKRKPDGLYRYQNNESKLISDNSDINEFSLFEHDGMLYYIEWIGEGCKLMQYNPEDEKITEILTCKDFSRNPKIVDKYFYYFDSAYEVKQIEIPH